MKSRKTQLILAVIVSLVCLFLFVRKIGGEWPLVWQAMKHVEYTWVILAVLLQFVAMWIRAMRWQSFLGQPWVSVTKLFLIANIGFMGNGVLPARLGELIRSFLVWRHTPHSFATAIATIIVERVFDLLVILLFLAYALYAFPFPASADAEETRARVQDLAFLGGLMFGVLISSILFMTYAPQLSLRIAAFIFRPLPIGISTKLLSAIEAFEKGASTFRRPESFLYSFLLSLVLWLVITYSEWIMLWAFNIDNVSFTGAMFLMTALCFAVMFPQAPGYIGVYQLAVLLVLSNVFQVSDSLSGAVAIMLWLTQVPPIIIIGLISLLVMGVSFTDITHVQEEIPVNTEENLTEEGALK